MRFDKTYNEMILLQTFEERFKYLKLHGEVCADTFGSARFINQSFYRSAQWQHVRSAVIARDNGCDLGCPDKPIFGTIYIHHINPITIEDFENGSAKLLDPNNLVCVSFETHNALHYGDESILHKFDYANRSPNDTCPWKIK